MEKSNAKIMTVSFLVSGVLVGIVTSVLLNTAAAIATGRLGVILNSPDSFLRHGLPAALGFITFLVLQFNKNINSWADEVVSELRKIVWPSRKNAVAMTIVVCIMVLISGLFLGLLDVLSAQTIDWLIHLNLSGLFS